MKLEILQEELNKALGSASHFSSSKVQLPVIANVLLKSEKNKLTLSATNLEMAVSISIGAKIEEEGSITVPAKTLGEIVSNLPKGTLKLSAEKEKLTIESSDFYSNLLGISASEFPKLPQDSVSQNLLIFPKTNFISSLSKMLFSVSLDETRPVLTGVLFVFKDNTLQLVSTDGFRLSLNSTKISTPVKDFSVIIPKNVLNELIHVSTEEENVGFSYDDKDNQVLFALGKTKISSRVIDGNFPDYKRIIPDKTRLTINTDIDDFSRAVKLSSVFAKDVSNVTKLMFSKGYIGFTSESGKAGSQKSQIPAKIEGLEGEENQTVAFNYKYLEDFLNIADGETVIIGIGNTDSPATFRDLKDTDFLHIIMPVKLSAD